MYRCEGDDGCDRWASAKGETYDEKLVACSKCPKNCSPPFRTDVERSIEKAIDAEAEALADTVRYLITWENAGIETDWSEYPFEIKRLFVVWRAAENEIKDRYIRLERVLTKAQFQTPQGT